MKIEFTDSKIQAMAIAIKAWKELVETARPCAPSEILLKWEHCDQEWGIRSRTCAQFSEVMKKRTSGYKAACLKASQEAYDGLMSDLRTIADGGEVQ